MKTSIDQIEVLGQMAMMDFAEDCIDYDKGTFDEEDFLRIAEIVSEKFDTSLEAVIEIIRESTFRFAKEAMDL